MHALQARVGASEQALAALEQTATEQMEGLTQQSSHALDRIQRQLSQAFSQLEQLHSFIKVLCQRGNDLLKEVGIYRALRGKDFGLLVLSCSLLYPPHFLIKLGNMKQI